MLAICDLLSFPRSTTHCVPAAKKKPANAMDFPYKSYIFSPAGDLGD
jgi:hypothetical protein